MSDSQVCPLTGEMMLFGYDLTEDAIQYSVISKAGKVLSTLPILFREPVMSHDMAITSHYTIVMDFPLWDMGRPTRVEDRSKVGVIPRHATSEAELVWFDLEGQFG